MIIHGGKYTLSNVYSSLKTRSPRLIFAFHRVSNDHSTIKNAFNRLSSISPSQLSLFIKSIKPIAHFKNLEETLSGKKERGKSIVIHLTFDDVSKSFLSNALPIIEKHKIPVTLFPSIKNTESGFSWRDKIYYILGKKELEIAFTEKIKSIFPRQKEIQTENIYFWSKALSLSQEKMETILDEILGDKLNDFIFQIKKNSPYLNWEQLIKLSKHPLITIGNHGYSHYNYNFMSLESIEKDIHKSQSLIKQKLGIECLHFTPPFGGISQKSYIAVDKILNKMNYQTVGWGKRASNSQKKDQALFHYFRIDSARNVVLNLIKTAKASYRTQHFPLYGIQFLTEKSTSQPPELTDTVSIEEYKNFYRLLFPDKKHHQNNNYINHLYYKNPFRKNRVSHQAIKSEGEVLAIGSLLYLPFSYNNQPKDGAYFCGWYRFPVLPSSTLRARTLFEKSLTMTSITGAYNPSSPTLSFYESWDKVLIYKLKAVIKQKKRRHLKTPFYHISPKWDNRLQPIIDESHKNLSLTVFRGSDLYKWRFENYPLCRFYYLYPENFPADWYVIYCIHEKIMTISDYCLADLTNQKTINDMMIAITHFASSQNIETIELETSNESTVQIARKYNFKPSDRFWTVYRHPKNKGQILPWEKVHETQLCGDLLPRIYPPQK